MKEVHALTFTKFNLFINDISTEMTSSALAGLNGLYKLCNKDTKCE